MGPSSTPPPRARADARRRSPSPPAPSGRLSSPSSKATSTRPRPATSWPATGCPTRSTARPTKGATCCCDRPVPAAVRADRARRAPARVELSAVPHPRPELRRRRARSGAAAGARAGGGPAPGAPPRLLVRPRVPGVGALLAGRRPLALHTTVGPRVSRDDRDLRTLDRGALLAPRPPAQPFSRRPSVGAVPDRLDRRRLGDRPPG